MSFLNCMSFLNPTGHHHLIMQIFVRDVSGRLIVLEVEGEWTLGYLHKTIDHHWGVTTRANHCKPIFAAD